MAPCQVLDMMWLFSITSSSCHVCADIKTLCLWVHIQTPEGNKSVRKTIQQEMRLYGETGTFCTSRCWSSLIEAELLWDMVRNAERDCFAVLCISKLVCRVIRTFSTLTSLVPCFYNPFSILFSVWCCMCPEQTKVLEKVKILLAVHFKEN